MEQWPDVNRRGNSDRRLSRFTTINGDITAKSDPLVTLGAEAALRIVAKEAGLRDLDIGGRVIVRTRNNERRHRPHAG